MRRHRFSAYCYSYPRLLRLFKDYAPNLLSFLNPKLLDDPKGSRGSKPVTKVQTKGSRSRAAAPA